MKRTKREEKGVLLPLLSPPPPPLHDFLCAEAVVGFQASIALPRLRSARLCEHPSSTSPGAAVLLYPDKLSSYCAGRQHSEARSYTSGRASASA